MQQREIENTGIPTLKISFNNVFGYYIRGDQNSREQGSRHLDSQTNPCQRGTLHHSELKEYEGKDSRSRRPDSRIGKRYTIPCWQQQPLISNRYSWMPVSSPYIDALISFANIAVTNNYHRPEINESFVIDIKRGRHPVIERQITSGRKTTSTMTSTLDNDKATNHHYHGTQHGEVNQRFYAKLHSS